MMTCEEIAMLLGMSTQAIQQQLERTIRGLWRKRVTIRPPNTRNPRVAARHARICELREQGWKITQIAKEMHVTSRAILRVLAKERSG